MRELREVYKVLLYSSLLLLSLISLSIALDSLGDVPELITLPPPPFADSYKGLKPPGSGQSLTNRQEIVIDASCGCPDNLTLNITGVTGSAYLRMRIGDLYNGSWILDETITKDYNGEALDYVMPRRSDEASYAFYVKPSIGFTGFIPNVIYTNELRMAEQIKYYPNELIFYNDKPVDEEYLVSYTNYLFDEDTLNRAPLKTDDSLLVIPKNVRDQIYPIAVEATQNQRTDYQKLKALESYLKNHYRYNVNYTRAPADIDPVLWFLLEEKEGVCIHFNSAFVLMARCLDLPARLVTGYSMSPSLQRQIVRPFQRHAWAEAEFEGCGWLTFDATPQLYEGLEDTDDGLIQTVTTITEQSTACFKGDSFSVSGIVTDEMGNSVNDLEVLVYLKKVKNETGILCAKEVVTNGMFNVDCLLPLNTEPGRYSVEAITIGNKIYNGSRSDPPLNVLSGTLINCTIPSKVVNNKDFTVEAVLVEERTGIPIPDSSCIVDIDGLGYTYFTNSTGGFAISSSFDEVTHHTMTIIYSGTEFYVGSEVSGNITSVPLEITPDPLPFLVRNEENYITGSVHADDLPGDNEYVMITVDGYEQTQTSSNKTGGFKKKIMIGSSGIVWVLGNDPTNTSIETNNQTVVLGNTLIRYVLLSNGYTATQITKVCMRPQLSVHVLNVSSWKKPFNVALSLNNDDGSPMRYRNITLLLNDKEISTLTNSDGKALIDVRLNAEPHDFKQGFSVSYAGEQFILPASFTDTIIFEEEWDLSNTIIGLLMNLLKIVALMFVAFIVWRTLIKYLPQKGIAPAYKTVEGNDIEDISVETLGVFKAKEDGASIDLEFPDLKPGLPYIWGMGENFRVKIMLSSKESDYTLIKTLYNDKEDEIKLDENYEIIKLYTFERKGTQAIIFKYNIPDKKICAITKLLLKIVDYREEIVEQFNENFINNISPSENYVSNPTARELLHILRRKLSPVKCEALKNMVHGFEEADYSHHVITRENFEAFYVSKILMDGKDVVA